MFRQKHVVLVVSRIVISAGIAAGVAILMTGCQQKAPRPGPTTQTADASPYFKSDDEALREGLEGYGTYLAMSDMITQSGGVDPQRIAPFVSENLLPSFVEGYDAMREKGLRSTGATAYDSGRLQSWSTDRATGAIVSFYLCIDVEQVRLLDSSGNDVTPAERAPRIPILATIAVRDSMSEAVLVENEPWSGDSFC
jgi:hypothetical protein